MIFIITLIFSIILFFVGLKNVDYAVGILTISYYDDLDIYDSWNDEGFDGKVRSYEDWYFIGLKQIYSAFILFVINSLIMVYYILDLKLTTKGESAK